MPVPPLAGPVSYPDLARKVAVVTGGSRGIGAATAQALAANGINCVAPSAIENDRMRVAMPPAGLDQLGASFPLGRIGQPADVAAATLFLASQASSWITGATLDFAGGKVMV